jgi:hypothetical protein
VLDAIHKSARTLAELGGKSQVIEQAKASGQLFAGFVGFGDGELGGRVVRKLMNCAKISGYETGDKHGSEG